MIYINPIAGAVWLTLFVAAVFVAKGIFQLIMGFQMRPHEGWGWIVAAGVIAIIVGLLIWFQWPLSTVYVLGVLAGLSFILRQSLRRERVLVPAPPGSNRAQRARPSSLKAADCLTDLAA